MLIYKMLERRLEKTKLNAYLIYIKYDGTKFDSFDENKGKISIKSTIKEYFEKENIRIYKGIQQAGRTDKDVSANENILYVMTEEINIDRLLKYDMIFKIEKTIAFLELPNLIESREYIFNYPSDKIINSEEKIHELCKKLSGINDYKKFTTKKGRLIQNTIRNIEIKYIDNKLYFKGNAFLPHQVRIMSSYILTNKITELDGRYLILDKINKSEKLNNIIFRKIEVDNEDICLYEVSKDYTLIYTKDLSKMIGKNGKNIKKLKINNKVLVRQI